MSDHGHDEPQTMSDEEFFSARREAMGTDYPGDEEMHRRDAEDDVDFRHWTDEQRNAPAPVEQPAAHAEQQPAPAQPTEWNAHDWVQEAFKDDPNFNQLSEEDRGRLETMAEERHAKMVDDVKEWATEFGEKWSGELKDRIVEGFESSPTLHDFVQTHLADGDFSEADQAALKETVEHMQPAEIVHAIRPLVEAGHEMSGEILDGAEMIIDHAIDDVHDIVEVRAEMPGGDSPEIHHKLEQLEEAPDQVHHALEWSRDQQEYEWHKAEAQMEAIEHGADPRSLHDEDTYQVDDNAHEHEAAEA
jgi:hypothetical protein